MTVNNSELRERFSKYCAAKRESPYKNIGLIGAIPDSSSTSKLSPAGDFFADKAFKTLRELGYAPPVNFVAQIINVNSEFGGRDFISPNFKAELDVAVFEYILRTRTEMQYYVRSQHVLTKPSPFEKNAPDSWLKSALRRNSKILITFGRATEEVSPEDFVGDHFECGASPYELIHTEPIPKSRFMPSEGATMNVMLHKDYM